MKKLKKQKPNVENFVLCLKTVNLENNSLLAKMQKIFIKQNTVLGYITKKQFLQAQLT